MPTSTDIALVFSGECGESIVTTGGAVEAGVVGSMECGRPRAFASGQPSLLIVLITVELGCAIGVIGRVIFGPPTPVKKGDLPIMGEAGGVSLFLSKFSNLERSDETGLIDDSSLPCILSSILCQVFVPPLVKQPF